MAETRDDVIREMREVVRDAEGSITKITVERWADRLDALRTPRCQDGFHLSVTSEKHRRCVNCGHEWSIK